MNTFIDFEQVYANLSHVTPLRSGDRVVKVTSSLTKAVFVMSGSGLGLRTEDVAAGIKRNFGINIDVHQIADALRNLRSQSVLSYDNQSGSYTINPHEKSVVESTNKNAKLVEDTMRTEWLSKVQEVEGELDDTAKDKLWFCLRDYMIRVFYQNGIQASELLNAAATAGRDNPMSFSENSATVVAKNDASEVKELFSRGLAVFIQMKSDAKDSYLAQVLNGTLTLFTLSSVPMLTQYFQSITRNMDVFMDTNFIFSYLNLHENPRNDVSKRLVSTIKENKNLSISFWYHESTLEELRRAIKGVSKGLGTASWNRELSEAIVEAKLGGMLEEAYHQQNVDEGLNPRDFLEVYNHIELVLDGYGFRRYLGKQEDRIGNHEEICVQYETFYEDLARRNGNTRRKSTLAIEHDVSVWETVQARRRGLPCKSIFDAGSFFLTNDGYFFAYDRNVLSKRDGRKGKVVSTVMPQHFMYLLLPMTGSTEDESEQAMIALTMLEFRAAANDYSGLWAKINRYLNMFPDMSKEAASRILASILASNDLEALNSIEDDEVLDKQLNKRVLQVVRKINEESKLARIAQEQLREEAERERVASHTSAENATNARRELSEASGVISSLQVEASSRDSSIEKQAGEISRLNALLEETKRKNRHSMVVISTIAVLVLSIITGVTFYTIDFYKPYSLGLSVGLSILTSMMLVLVRTGRYNRKSLIAVWGAASTITGAILYILADPSDKIMLIIATVLISGLVTYVADAFTSNEK